MIKDKTSKKMPSIFYHRWKIPEMGEIDYLYTFRASIARRISGSRQTAIISKVQL
jgi:hypothetical protein